MIFCFLMLGMFMATLDNQIVSTALPTIIGEFGALERFGWISSAYLLAQSTIMPVYGKLGDLFGRKYVMITAVILFTIGSLACGMAWSMDSLIAARVLQGLGGGGIMVSIFAINADLFPPRERARYQSFSSLVLMASGSIGPALGGGLSQTFGWRSIFLVNLPIGVIVVVALLILLPRWRPNRKPRIDYAGAVALAVAIAGVVLWADSQSIFGSLIAPAALALPVISALALVLWIRIQRHAPEPIMPLTLFRDRNFGLLLVIALASGAIAIGMVNYHALFLQMTTGLSPASAGLFFIAVTGGIAIGALAAGRLIERTGVYKPWMIIGFGLSVLCLSGLAFVPIGTPFAVLAGLLLGQGIAIGLGQQGPVIGAQASAPARDVGAATGAVALSRMAGASLAISIYGAILSDRLVHQIIAGVGAVSTLTPAKIEALPPIAAQAVATAYRAAFVDIYLVSAGMAAVALIAALSLKPVVLAQAKASLPAKA
ncbi:MAG TPA: MDR family MFS transporter [Paenirhodobacter sp.]